MSNPAFVNWVIMVKGAEEKPVHPGNVENHERTGWVRKEPSAAEPKIQPAYQSLTLPELTEALVEQTAEASGEAAVSNEEDTLTTEVSDQAEP